jgi:hypothetical protein
MTRRSVPRGGAAKDDGERGTGNGITGGTRVWPEGPFAADAMSS